MSAVGVRVSPEWLALREPADAAARSAELAGRLARHLPAAGPLVIHDLGGGSGAMGRWLAPRLPGPQHWVLHDHDADLLERAVAAPPRAAAVSRSSSAEATTRLASASSPVGRSVTSECLASTVTAAARGGAAAARSSRSASRSCSTQCCGPGSCGASQRPIAPVPPPRSWTTRAPEPARCRARRAASSVERAAASAGSRSSSHCGLTVALIPRPPRGRARSPWPR